MAWGFFGHRLNLYRSAIPHAGFGILRRWAERLPCGWFVFTTNVDGQFQKAGFPENRIVEQHGSIHHLQCVHQCGHGLWQSDGVRVDVDDATIRARSKPPRCPGCGSIARPNILMFGDWEWDPSRYAAQALRYEGWLRQVQGRRLVAVELGAGLAIPRCSRLMS